MQGDQKNFYLQFRSPIPPHLSPEERETWEKEQKWEQQEHERRKKLGYYPHEKSDQLARCPWLKRAPDST
jgi:hypothetical protein